MAPARWTVVHGRTVSLERGGGADALDAVLLPGLVNAHAHLDLGSGPPLPAEGSFPDWLWSVGGIRLAERDVAAEAESVAADLMRHGVVAVGDIDGTQGAGTAGRRRAGLGGRSFLEIVGVHKAGARARLAACLALIDRLGTGTDELGLSPHAPYSVHADVLPEIVRAATARGLPLAMHLAESPEETRYLTHGDGPFVGFLERIGKGPPFPSAPGVRPIAYAERAGFLAAGGLVIHGNDLADEDIDALARHQASVVYCHGTHAHFDRPAHRIADLLQAGVNVALGTDSAASNPRLDLFDELQRLTLDRPDLDPKALLAAATLGGRRALGLPPGVAVWERETTADGLLIGPAPEDLGRMSPAALAEWALSGQPQPLITVRGGLIRPLEPISAQLDSWIGQG